jgi:hypothetical protein
LTTLIVAGYFFLVNLLTDMAIEKFVDLYEPGVREYTGPEMTMENLVNNIWWPGCGYVKHQSDFSECDGDCFSAKMMDELEDFNKKHSGNLVKFFSRDMEGIENVALEGWWLPAPNEDKKDPAPRIVVQHGFKENSNHYRTYFAAFQLRKLGFSVLLTNFRDHGYSDNSSDHINEWGDAYPYDLLGAWDYARMDPHGHLGGEMPSAKVGIMGFSKGAFTTVNAFGLEGDVPAAWVDSPPFTPKVVFAHGAGKELQSMHIGFLTSTLVDPAWDRVLDYAYEIGSDYNKHLPEKVLPFAPDNKRPISVVSNVNDDTVPISEMDSLVSLIEKYPNKYVLTSHKFDGKCVDRDGDPVEDHCVDHLNHADDYSKRLCMFWNAAFDMSTDSC